MKNTFKHADVFIGDNTKYNVPISADTKVYDTLLIMLP